MKKKKLVIWFCEDEEDMRQEQKKIITKRFPKANITHFENAGYAAQSSGSPDYIIIDVGGAMGNGCDVASLARYNVEGLAEIHPGAIFIITSALGYYAKDAFDRLQKEIQGITRVVDSYSISTICDIIEECK